MEQAIKISCGDDNMIGIYHEAEGSAQDCGVLIVVGGPQTRVGSHRQFVLLARALAQQGFPCLRFDYRGMGDSDGEQRDFEQVQQDIRAAADWFFSHYPAMQKLVLWGLCDAASANLFYAYEDNRVSGMVLLNPWVRTESGEAQAYLKHYYLQRLLSREFWSKMLKGKLNIRQSLSSFMQIAKKAKREESANHRTAVELSGSLPQRMYQAWQQFERPVLLILSGQDLTAAEFKDLVDGDKDWQALLARDTVQRKDFKEANHTFSKQQWRDQVAQWTVQWLREKVD